MKAIEDIPDWKILIGALILTALLAYFLADFIPDSDEAMKHYSPQPDWTKIEKAQKEGK